MSPTAAGLFSTRTSRAAESTIRLLEVSISVKTGLLSGTVEAALPTTVPGAVAVESVPVCANSMCSIITGAGVMTNVSSSHWTSPEAGFVRLIRTL